jgi:hypothetical protein
VSKEEYERLGEAFEGQETKVLGEKGYERIVEEVAQIERKLGIYELLRSLRSSDQSGRAARER